MDKNPTRYIWVQPILLVYKSLTPNLEDPPPPQKKKTSSSIYSTQVRYKPTRTLSQSSTPSQSHVLSRNLGFFVFGPGTQNESISQSRIWILHNSMTINGCSKLGLLPFFLKKKKEQQIESNQVTNDILFLLPLIIIFSIALFTPKRFNYSSIKSNPRKLKIVKQKHC